jgi:hypothetical protein
MTETIPTPGAPPGPAARTARRHIAVVCRSGTTGLGPNLARGLVDLTEDRIKVRLNSPIPVGEDVEIELSPPGVGKPIKLRGSVATSRPSTDGKSFVSKVLLRHRLTFRQLADLTI